MQTVCAIAARQVVNMSNGVKSSTFRLAFCSVIAALSVVLMLITSFIPIGTYALPCFAGILTVAVVIEYGRKWAFAVFAVVSLLSLFISADKEAVLYFIALFGYYPILKGIFEKHIKNRVLQYILKFVVFNAAAVVSFFIATMLLSVPLEEFEIFGVYLPVLFLLIGNVFFLFYDYAVTVILSQYVLKIRDKIFRKN